MENEATNTELTLMRVPELARKLTAFVKKRTTPPSGEKTQPPFPFLTHPNPYKSRHLSRDLANLSPVNASTRLRRPSLREK